MSRRVLETVVGPVPDPTKDRMQPTFSGSQSDAWFAAKYGARADGGMELIGVGLV